MHVRRLLVTTALSVATFVLVPATAEAATGFSAFGQHVRPCAQTMGFSGMHNPGMHHGAAGSDGMACG